MARRKAPRLQALYSTLRVDQDPEQAAAEYGEICAYWGRLGGRETLRRHGRQHYVKMARRRWAGKEPA